MIEDQLAKEASVGVRNKGTIFSTKIDEKSETNSNLDVISNNDNKKTFLKRKNDTA